MMWYLLVLNVSILVTVSVFSVSAMSHVAISWVMREEFEIAMRCVRVSAHVSVYCATYLFRWRRIAQVLLCM